MTVTIDKGAPGGPGVNSGARVGPAGRARAITSGACGLPCVGNQHYLHIPYLRSSTALPYSRATRRAGHMFYIAS